MYKSRIILKKKPLVEAIFEMRWGLQELPGNRNCPPLMIDPHYNIFLGRMYDRLSSSFPVDETLPSASMPREISAYVIQNRLRKEEHKWPLVQMGPGILTLNDTEGYQWETFRPQVNSLVDKFFESYPAKGSVNIKTVGLRYIDAILFDYEKDDIFIYLEEKLKIKIGLSESLFEGTGVQRKSSALNLAMSFPCEKPKANINVKFSRGTIRGEDCLVWETNVVTVEGETPQLSAEILNWTEEAHDIAGDWFFKFIAGDLLQEFK